MNRLLTAVMACSLLGLASTSFAQTSCDADLDEDGVVGGADLALVLNDWGGCKGCAGDITGDGAVDGIDLAIVLSRWGGQCIVPWAQVLQFAPDPAVVTDEELRASILKTGLPWRVRDLASDIEMLLVPPGTFLMGCSSSDLDGCDSDENPVHEVTLTKAFYLGRYEITQAQWTAVIGSNPSSFQGFADSNVRPVEGISLPGVTAFEAITGLRRPTEAEWEWAARAGTTTAFNNGSNEVTSLAASAWYSATAFGESRPVGTRLPNRLGFHDMHGNVWEWVADAATEYPIGPVTDPFVPATSNSGILRGGSWALPSFHNRVSYRAQFNPSGPSYAASRGLRAARNP